MGSRQELLQRSIPFLREIKDMTPGAEMEQSGTYVLFDAPTRLSFSHRDGSLHLSCRYSVISSVFCGFAVCGCNLD